MLRKFLDWQLSLTEKGKPLHKLRYLIEAGDTFLYEAPNTTKTGPQIRDAVDIKRWMLLVVFALIPCILWAIWNTGLQKMVYSGGDFRLMEEYIRSRSSLADYFAFVGKDGRFIEILKLGLLAFIPIVVITYVVGGAVEALFAVVRGHPISEGFLVTGILYALILPPTMPYWMVAVGIAMGVFFGKELFGGSGMNIMNPALTARAFLFFTFPGKMTGNVWVGTNPTVVRESLLKMNQDAGKEAIDGYTQATKLGIFNSAGEVQRVHVDAITANEVGSNVGTIETIQQKFSEWSAANAPSAALGELNSEQLQNFVTSTATEGGLGLSTGVYEDALHFAHLQNGLGDHSTWNLFFGDRLGSMGEVSPFCCLLGAIFLIWVGIGSWRVMLSVMIGAYITALGFEWVPKLLGADGGAWSPAMMGFPAYKHLLLGGLAFGAVFMATDPVSSPDMLSAKWIYGIFIGVVAVVIRVINPAFPEGVMLSILLANVFAPLFDYYAALGYRKRRVNHVKRATA
ncbi:MAG: NADH:ubiquinone reductase (Na(+)-transporting) subunit B [Waddliaceae bacterium]